MRRASLAGALIALGLGGIMVLVAINRPAQTDAIKPADLEEAGYGWLIVPNGTTADRHRIRCLWLEGNIQRHPLCTDLGPPKPEDDH